MGEMRWNPMPDGSYWDGAKLRFVRVKGDLLQTGYDYDPGCEVKLNKDYRLCQLVPSEPVLTMPSAEVQRVLWTAMYNLRSDIAFDTITLAPEVRENMNAALAWLDSLKGTEHEPAE